MRRFLPVVLACAACGGGASDRSGAKNAKDGDHDFAAYAAEHGIASLNGGGDAPEVTADGLRFEGLQKDRPMKLDGVLNEWPAPAKATTNVRGNTKAGLKVSLQYDDAKLYVGADVTDSSFEAGKDHVELVFAVPSPGGSYTTYDVNLFPGKPGDTEGSIRYARGGGVAGAKIVEAPGTGGYSFEATIPWTSLPELRTTRVGVHGFAAYVDSDGTIATGPSDVSHPHDMAWVPSESELSMIEQLLGPKGYTKRAPAAELVADLTGDGVRERVAVWDDYVTICGSQFLGGSGFFYRDMGGPLVKLEARDVTGRGKADVVLRVKHSVGNAEREVLEVITADSASTEPHVSFAHEIAVRQSSHHIDNAVHMARGEIDVTVEPTTTWDALTYKEPIANDVEPILFPWGTVKSQVFRFDGKTFTKGKEFAQSPSAAPAGEGRGGGAPPPRPAEPPTPKVTQGGDLSGSLLAQYKRDRGVGGDVSPTVDLKVQVAGDGRPERVVLMGRDIVVFGPGFKGGSGYIFLTLAPFADASDIKDVSARDVTGDGAADLVVRGVRHQQSDQGPVDTEVIFVYQVKQDAITRIFAIETAREQGSKRIQGLVQFIPGSGGKTFDVLAGPGRATGWTEKTYPFPQDPSGSNSVEPLILPWSGVSNVRYSWNGSTFAKN